MKKITKLMFLVSMFLVLFLVSCKGRNDTKLEEDTFANVPTSLYVEEEYENGLENIVELYDFEYYCLDKEIDPNNFNFVFAADPSDTSGRVKSDGETIPQMDLMIRAKATNINEIKYIDGIIEMPSYINFNKKFDFFYYVTDTYIENEYVVFTVRIKWGSRFDQRNPSIYFDDHGLGGAMPDEAVVNYLQRLSLSTEGYTTITYGQEDYELYDINGDFYVKIDGKFHRVIDLEFTGGNTSLLTYEEEPSNVKFEKQDIKITLIIG